MYERDRSLIRESRFCFLVRSLIFNIYLDWPLEWLSLNFFVEGTRKWGLSPLNASVSGMKTHRSL